jgi:hypothetical protein
MKQKFLFLKILKTKILKYRLNIEPDVKAGCKKVSDLTLDEEFSGLWKNGFRI